MSLKEHWDAQAEAWARLVRTPGRDHCYANVNLPAFLGLLPPPGRATLDLGCGEGRLGAELALAGHRVVGVDSSPRMVELARGRHEALVADAADLPFADGAFDLVVAFMSLMDLDDLDGAVAEAARVLEPGGRLVASIEHPLNKAGRFESRDPDARFVIEDSYFERRLVVEETRDFAFAKHKHPLEDYSRALERAGLLIEALREPAYVGRPRWDRVPLFLLFRAVKP